LGSIGFVNANELNDVLLPVQKSESETPSNLSPIHTGKYRIDGSTIVLEGFGVLNIITFTSEEFNFSFKLEDSEVIYECRAVKQENKIASTTRTDMLCRAWKFGNVINPENGMPDIVGGVGLFTKAGTYLAMYPDGTAELDEWRWADAEEKTMEITTHKWQAKEIVDVELTASTLKFEVRNMIFECILAD
jgi:hypothetical protein